MRSSRWLWSMVELQNPLARHQLVWIGPREWRAMLAEHLPVVAPALLADWADRSWPLIARASVCCDSPGLVPLGLPLPPEHGKRRLFFECRREIVARTTRPPRLAEAAFTAPTHWQKTIAAILALDPETRCFGSLAWEHLTGLAYLSPESDLDLLWEIGASEQADGLCDALAAIAADAPLNIDGELTASKGQAVQWREWHSGGLRLMIKTTSGARLVWRDRLFE